MHVAELNIYPIKSTAQVNLETAMVLPTGLENDRKWLLIDENQEMITARAYPELLKIKSGVQDRELSIDTPQGSFTFCDDADKRIITFKFFSEQLSGVPFSAAADEWFSDYLGIKCQLIHQKDVHRPMLAKRGGKSEDQVNYGDEAPLLLIGSGSLEDLNSRLSTPVTMRHFRPNIVLDETSPYEEDQWRRIRIGACEFDVAQVCRRCVFTTINPLTLEKDKKGEPLRTLSGYRKTSDGGVAFGVHLIPRKPGAIRLGDEVTLID